VNRTLIAICLIALIVAIVPACNKPENHPSVPPNAGAPPVGSPLPSSPPFPHGIDTSEVSQAELDDPEAPTLPADQCVPLDQCESFCTICQRLVECKTGEMRIYQDCVTGCLKVCRKNQISLEFRDCLQQAQTCAEIKICAQNSPHNELH